MTAALLNTIELARRMNGRCAMTKRGTIVSRGGHEHTDCSTCEARCDLGDMGMAGDGFSIVGTTEGAELKWRCPGCGVSVVEPTRAIEAHAHAIIVARNLEVVILSDDPLPHNAALSARADARPEEASEYSEAAELMRDALEAAQREPVQDEHDAVRIMRTVIDKGHRYVLIVEPRDSGSRMQMNSGMRRIEIAQMLERCARGAREDARLGGDE